VGEGVEGGGKRICIKGVEEWVKVLKPNQAPHPPLPHASNGPMWQCYAGWLVEMVEHILKSVHLQCCTNPV